MKTGKKLALCLVLLASSPAFAEPSITAKVSATDMTLDSSITLILDIQGINNVGAAPQLQLQDFQIQPAGQTSSFQWVNGQSSSLVTFNYVLTPTKTGQLLIPSLTLQVGGRNYATQPITVTVRAAVDPAAAAPSGAARDPGNRTVTVPTEGLKPVFVSASVDTDKVYVGQQIVLKVQFLRRPDVQFASQPRYSEPDLAGFLIEPLDKQDFSTTITGTRYDVTEIPYALFPTSDGELVIGSAQVELAVRTAPDAFDPNSFFQNFFGRAEVARLSTRALAIHVRSLPVDKPASFSGAVGRYKISSKVDVNDFEVGKPFSLITTIDGVGNVKSLKEPVLPELKGFRRYETISSAKISKEGKFIHGSKEFKTLLIPQVSGHLVIPAIQYSFFNPAKSAYETTATSEINLNAKPGQINPDEPTRSPAASSFAPSESVRVVERDIRFIKGGQVRPLRPPVYNRAAFYIALLFPLIFVAAAAIVRMKHSHRAEHSGLYRSKGALGVARRELKKASSILTNADPAPFYSHIHVAVAGFLADKLGLSISGLRWDVVEQKLMEKNVSPELLRAVRDIFDQADMARFAASSFAEESRPRVLTTTKETLTVLDKKI